MVNILILIGLSLLAGFLYRAGGADWGNTKWRDLGVPIVMIYAMSLLRGWDWSLIPCAFLLFGSLTTYNKWASRSKTDVLAPSWAVTGAFYGLSMLPYAFFTGHWWMMGARTVILALFVCGWSEAIDDVKWEDGGRGFSIIATLPLFLIGG